MVLKNNGAIYSKLLNLYLLFGSLHATRQKIYKLMVLLQKSYTPAIIKSLFLSSIRQNIVITKPPTITVLLKNTLYENIQWYRHITVEPPMFLYMMAYMITNVIEQEFYIFRACTVNHGYSEEICHNITNYPDIYNEVQVTMTWFLQWSSIAGHIVPCILAFFLGSYSDKRGRKIILLAGLLGKLFFSIMITVNTMKAWPLDYAIYTAWFPSALTGADLAIFSGCFSYIADVSSLKNRTLRVGILDVVYLSTMPTGVALGNVLYNKVFDKSFTAMFLVNTILMLLATLYTLIYLEWQTTPQQKSWREDNTTNPITDFFDLNNIKATVITLTKRRTNHRRLFLWLLLISMAFYTFQRDERSVMFLYTKAVFKWNATDFSNFRTYLSSAYVLVMLIGIPLMTKVLNWKDTVIVMLGAIAHMTGHFIYAQSSNPNIFYVGATAAALGPCVAPLLRSMASKVLLPGERGVAYAFLSVMENAVAIFASIVYSNLYRVTLNTDHTNAIFYLTMGTQAFVFTFTLLMEILLKGKRLEVYIEQQQKDITETD